MNKVNTAEGEAIFTVIGERDWKVKKHKKQQPVPTGFHLICQGCEQGGTGEVLEFSN